MIREEFLRSRDRHEANRSSEAHIAIANCETWDEDAFDLAAGKRPSRTGEASLERRGPAERDFRAAQVRRRRHRFSGLSAKCYGAWKDVRVGPSLALCTVLNTSSGIRGAPRSANAHLAETSALSRERPREQSRTLRRGRS